MLDKLARMSEPAYVIGGSDVLSEGRKFYVHLEKGFSDIIAIFKGVFT